MQKVTMRPYQATASTRAVACFHKHRSSLIVLPTGTGKTEVFAALAARATGRCLVLVHRDELAEQAYRKIERATELAPEIEKAESYAMRNAVRQSNGLFRCVVASVQTLSQEGRLRSWRRDAFSLIIIDEAHRAAKKNKSYAKIIDHFSAAKVLGVTATADRHDRELIIGPGKTFESLAYE